MTLGEGTVINGSGVQTTTNSRWGDYTDMTVDPVDDCTFWYVNDTMPSPGRRPTARPWQTRIASFKLTRLPIGDRRQAYSSGSRLARTDDGGTAQNCAKIACGGMLSIPR